MAKRSNSNSDKSGGDGSKPKPKPKPKAKSVPVNVVTPGQDGRSWRGDTADFSKERPDITTFDNE